MLRSLLACTALAVLAGCISFSSTESAEAVPDYRSFCQDKEAQCRQICGNVGVQTFACKAGPSEGLDYRCECRKPAAKNL
jgi:hypothetical protein